MIQRPEIAVLILLAGGLALPAQAARAGAVLAIGSAALGTAALATGFHPVTAGLLFAGALGAAAAGIRGGRRGILLGVGAALAVWSARGLWMITGVGTTLLATLAVGAAAGLGLRLTRVLPNPPPPGPTPPMPRGPVALLVFCMVLAWVGHHLALVVIGAAGASWAGWLSAQSAKAAGWPVVPLLVTTMLLAVYLFLATIAGAEGLGMHGLAELPISPAAELMLAAALLLASWLLSGLWPLPQRAVAPFLAPAAAAVLARVGAVAAPAGMEHWQALAAPAALLGICHAAWTRRIPALAVGGAWLALSGVEPLGVTAAAWLIPSAVLLAMVPAEDDGSYSLWNGARLLAMLGAGWGGFLALEAGLHGEVVYTVLTFVGTLMGLARGTQAMTPSAPRRTWPSS